MKILLPLLLIASAQACPDFNGAFRECTSTNTEYPLEAMEFSQFGSHFNIFATSNGRTMVEDVFADGQVQIKTVEVDGMKIKVDVKATCSDEKLVLESYVRAVMMEEKAHFSIKGDELRIENFRDGYPSNVSTCKRVD